MAIVRIEGFDHYDALTAAGKLELGANSVINPTAGRFGGGALSVVDNPSNAYIPLGANYQEIILGAAIKVGATAGWLIDFISSGGNLNVRVNLGVDIYQLYIYRGIMSIIGIYTLPTVVNEWLYLEARVKISPTAGFVEIRANGVSIGSFSGNTYGGVGPQDINKLNIYLNHPQHFVDDLYVIDTSVAPNQTYLGDCRVNTVYPNAEGDYLEWTPYPASPHYTKVNEHPPDGDTTYVETPTKNNRDFYQFGDVPSNAVIHGIAINSYIKKTDTEITGVQLGTRVGTSDYYSVQKTIAGSYAHITQVQNVNPATGVAWTPTGFNAAQFGIKLAT